MPANMLKTGPGAAVELPLRRPATTLTSTEKSSRRDRALGAPLSRKFCGLRSPPRRYTIAILRGLKEQL